MEYPLADEYTLDGVTPLDKMGVEQLTRAIQKTDGKRRRLTGPENWKQRLPVPDNTWEHLATIYTSSMMTARDTHLHFKHLTHRRIGTYNRFADRDKTCRMCKASNESSTHLGKCPRVVKIFETLDKLARYIHSPKW